MQINYQGSILPLVTISAGIAIYPEDGKNLVDLLAKADEALYAAKQAGRNRVVKLG